MCSKKLPLLSDAIKQMTHFGWPRVRISSSCSDLGGKYGNYLKYKRSKFIIIDAQRTPESMLPFVCAHELGHALCTPNDNTQWLKTYTMDINADRVERLANMFAVELLLNDGYLAEHPGTSIYTLANCRGVPHRFIKLKKSGRDI